LSSKSWILDPDPQLEKMLDPDLQKINADPQPRLFAGSSFFSSRQVFFSICILKHVPNFEVYSYSGNVVATETVVREPKKKTKITWRTAKKLT
jgi:hypothetical protein